MVFIEIMVDLKKDEEILCYYDIDEKHHRKYLNYFAKEFSEPFLTIPNWGQHYDKETRALETYNATQRVIAATKQSSGDTNKRAEARRVNGKRLQDYWKKTKEAKEKMIANKRKNS